MGQNIKNLSERDRKGQKGGGCFTAEAAAGGGARDITGEKRCMNVTKKGQHVYLCAADGSMSGQIVLPQAARKWTRKQTKHWSARG